MPDLAGMKLGHQRRYLVYEVHIDNPQLLEDIEITNFVKFHTTTVLRPNDAGSMTIGDPAVTLPTIPIESKLCILKTYPFCKQSFVIDCINPCYFYVSIYLENYHHYETTCSSTCTNIYPESRVVFSSYLHMHKVGRQIWYSQTKFNDNGNFKEKLIMVYHLCLYFFHCRWDF